MIKSKFWVLLLSLSVAACGGGGGVSNSSGQEAGAAGESGGAAGDTGAGGEAGAGGNTGAGGEAGAGSTNEPPGTVGSAERCIISADCPEGTHCDLGECIQDCNSDSPCAKGYVCSERARYIKANAPDVDPPVVTQHAGSIIATPLAQELGERDRTFDVHLSTSSTAPVDYRVELRAPFLKLVGGERGSFKGGTSLSFRVNTSGLSGTVTSGTIRFHTSLGDVTVNPSIRVGLTGAYQGVMRYKSGSTAFGEVGVAIDMLDEKGDVAVRVNPEHSMTFPRTASGVATGRGVFTFSEGLSVTVTQRIDETYGGARNHFQRPLGRRVAFALKPNPGGRLEGTFQETVYGLLAEPIVLEGYAYLEPSETAQSVDFAISDPIMPIVGASEFASIGLFPGWVDRGQSDTVSFGRCSNIADGATSFQGRFIACGPGDLGCISNVIEQTYYEPLRTSLAAVRSNADPMDDIANVCEAELSVASLVEYGGNRSCALTAPLACALRDVASQAWEAGDLPIARATGNRLFARVLAPSLLVAQNHIVAGLKQSFEMGTAAELARFQKARDVLDAPLTFVLASAPLQYLRSLPVADAAGDPNNTDSTQTNFPAGRALARALYVLHTLDGEAARLDAASVGSQADKIARAQERGVLGLLEAIALSSVLDAWGNPPNLGNEAVGSLTLSDRGFQALQQGALAFGVPMGEVPLVFSPNRPAPTNFEQILGVLALPALNAAKLKESQFRDAQREFEQNQERLKAELGSVRSNIDEQILDICGGSFPLDTIKADADWQACGAGTTGQVAEQSLNIQQAYLRLRSAQSRMEGMEQKLAIDHKRLADTQNVHESTLAFIDGVGDQRKALIMAEGFINIMEKTIEIASNASLFNGGAPLGMAVVAGMLEAERTGIQVARDDLQTAQELRAVADSKQIDLINGMAQLQNQLIDMAQLRVDTQQELLGVTQADLQRRNSIEKAKRLFEDRGRVLTRISTSPFSDPMFRVLESRAALAAVQARADAQRWLYLSGRALEYELNMPLGDAFGRAVLGAYNSAEAEALGNCLGLMFSDYSQTFGVAQDFTTTISVRRMLGITGPRTDAVTGEELSEGELFRRAVLKNENLDAQGTLNFTFSTDLSPGNKLWATDLCSDKVSTVQAQIVGDFQGDNEAQVKLVLEGGALLRSCDSEEITNWNIDESTATIDAGVNTFGETRANSTLFGQSVARTSWKVVISAGTVAPANADLNLEHIDDIVLKIAHKALPRQTKSTPVSTACLGSIGAGG